MNTMLIYYLGTFIYLGLNYSHLFQQQLQNSFANWLFSQAELSYVVLIHLIRKLG